MEIYRPGDQPLKLSVYPFSAQQILQQIKPAYNNNQRATSRNGAKKNLASKILLLKDFKKTKKLAWQKSNHRGAIIVGLADDRDSSSKTGIGKETKK